MMLLEAASLGTPIICSDIAENKEVLSEDAIYFRSGDPSSLLEQLNWALTHKAEALLIGDCARERIRANYTWDKIAARYAQLYAKVLAN